MTGQEGEAARAARRMRIDRRRKEFLSGCPRHPDTDQPDIQHHELIVTTRPGQPFSEGAVNLGCHYTGCGCTLIVRLDTDTPPNFT